MKMQLVNWMTWPLRHRLGEIIGVVILVAATVAVLLFIRHAPRSVLAQPAAWVTGAIVLTWAFFAGACLYRTRYRLVAGQ